MALLGLKCPHCLKDNMTFVSCGERAHEKPSNKSTVFFTCNACFKAVSATVEPSKVGPGSIGLSHSPHAYKGDLRNSVVFHITEIYPEVKRSETPQFLPSDVDRVFRQAKDALKTSSFDAAGMMAGKALELSTKLLLDGEQVRNLGKRIDQLAKDGVLTTGLAEWSHHVRLLRNDAAHEFEFNEASAREAVEFVELYLVYVHTMPGLIEDAKRRVASLQNPTD